MPTPLLSVGMIFRNDIRSLERCLKALRPLRDAVPCELVMADTGSEDGSRAVAERYADVLFDLVWPGDFSAARNTVMDRCSGRWYFTVDSDEYLDGNITELVKFLHNPGRSEFAMVIQRNYFTFAMDGIYSDVLPVRLARMSTGARYEGAIHEKWPLGEGKVQVLPHTVLHHDGYVGVHGPEGKEKRKRNLTLLQKELEKEPENLQRHLQLIESSEKADTADYVRAAMELVERKVPGWDFFGPPIIRHGVVIAWDLELPVLDEWIKKAEELFPDSMFIRLDVEFVAILNCRNQHDYARCAERGGRWLWAWREYRDKKESLIALMVSAITTAGPRWEQEVRIVMADAYRNLNQPERAIGQLEQVDCSFLDEKMVARLTQVMVELHIGSEVDTAPLVKRIWDGITTPKPSQNWAEDREAAFLQVAVPLFSAQAQAEEAAQQDFHRHGYTLFSPLLDRCELGRGAALLEAAGTSGTSCILAKVEDWSLFPIEALAGAIEHGITFPTPESPLSLEEMDLLATRLAQDQDRIFELVRQAVERGWDTAQALAWTRGLVLAAIEQFDWKDEQAGMALCRQFAAVEEDFLPCCYSEDTLSEEKLFLLPPVHRFGWYCIRAFHALDNGDSVEYVRLLRKGLNASRGMKPMVEFLTKNTPELRKPSPSEELLALAEQFKAVLAQFPLDDPAVIALKCSDAYQKVAYLL